MIINYRADLVRIIDTKKPVAELGVAEGLFSRDMLKNWGIPKLYSVDAWMTINQPGDGGFAQEWHDKNYENAVKLLSEFGERSVILRGLTHKMVSFVSDNSLGLLYIDADHSYNGVMRDLNAWYNKVSPGGVIAGHDFGDPSYGVKRAFTDFANNVGAEIKIIREDNIFDMGGLFF